jgi:hypothetical protein
VTGTGSGSSSFCGQAKSDIKTLQTDLAGLASISSSPQRLKATMQTVIAAYQQAEQQAPDEIKPDIAVVSTFMSQLNQAFAAHNAAEVGQAEGRVRPPQGVGRCQLRH